MVDLPVRLLLQRGADKSFQSVLSGLRCRDCGGKPAPVYLVAGLIAARRQRAARVRALELVPGG